MRHAAFAALVAALVLAVNAPAKGTSKGWSNLTLIQKRVAARHEIEKRRQVVRWWIRYRRHARYPTAAVVLRFRLVRCRAIGIRSPGWVCVQGQHLVRALALERRLDERILLASLPPHHALWMCEHGHEAADWQNDDTGHNGHYGGMQMHPDWGYGTSHLASEDSQMTQEWAAEDAYKASGYSRAWLYGQWAHPDCLAFA